jgi:adenine deaminase
MQLTATVSALEGQAQLQQPQAAATKIVLAGKLFDPYTLQLLDNQAITICNDSGMILDVSPFSGNGNGREFSGKVIDLRHLTVLPGFVDTHVHCKRTTFISGDTESSQAATCCQSSSIRTRRPHGRSRLPKRPS